MYKCEKTMLNLPDRLAAEIEQVTEFQIDELIQIVILDPEQKEQYPLLGNAKFGIAVPACIM